MPRLLDLVAQDHGSLVALAVASSARAVENALAAGAEPARKPKPDRMSFKSLDRLMRHNGGGRLGSET